MDGTSGVLQMGGELRVVAGAWSEFYERLVLPCANLRNNHQGHIATFPFRSSSDSILTHLPQLLNAQALTLAGSFLVCGASH